LTLEDEQLTVDRASLNNQRNYLVGYLATEILLAK